MVKSLVDRIRQALLGNVTETFDLEAIAATLANTKIGLLVAANMYAYDGTTQSRLKVESATNPNLRVSLYDGISLLKAASGADGQNNASNGLLVYKRGQTFNETTWDRERGNTEVVALASGVRTTTTSSADLINYNAKAAIVTLNITAADPAGTVQIKLEGKVDGTYQTLGSSTAVNAITSISIIVGAGCDDLGGEFNGKNDVSIPRTFRVRIAHGNTTSSFTYSVSVALII